MKGDDMTLVSTSEKTSRGNEGGRRERTTTCRRWGELAALLAATAIALAACSGSSAPSATSSPTLASLATTTTTAGGITTTTRSGGSRSTTTTLPKGNTSQSPVAFAQCMRSHGFPNFPDPVTIGDKTDFLPGPSSGIDERSPKFQAADQVCRKYIPGSGPLPPTESAQDQRDLLKYAECMRSHGVPNFPDPVSHFENYWGFSFPPNFDQNSPIYLRANQACQHLEPGHG